VNQLDLTVITFHHAGFVITDYGDGIRPFDNRLGFVTSYLAKKEDVYVGFAFAIK
jgi:hypothetical protein